MAHSPTEDRERVDRWRAGLPAHVRESYDRIIATQQRELDKRAARRRAYFERAAATSDAGAAAAARAIADEPDDFLLCSNWPRWARKTGLEATAARCALYRLRSTREKQMAADESVLELCARIGDLAATFKSRRLFQLRSADDIREAEAARALADWYAVMLPHGGCASAHDLAELRRLARRAER